MAKTTKAFKPSIAAEKEFYRQLKKVAQQASHVVELHVKGHTLWQEGEMMRRLREYSVALGPWAARQSAKMLEKVSKKNRTEFNKNSKKLGKIIRENIAQEHIGDDILALMNEQVDLIQSIPLEAGKRAQSLALSAQYEGRRADEVAEELSKTGHVTESRAMLIARTEVARSSAVITQARAEAAGSTQYIWRTSEDAAVRPAHKKMNGKVFDWDHPPTLSDGTTGAPGTFPNCRCYAEPFFPEE